MNGEVKNSRAPGEFECQSIDLYWAQEDVCGSCVTKLHWRFKFMDRSLSLSVSLFLSVFSCSLLSGMSEVNPLLQSWYCFSACCHCAIQNNQRGMRDIQRRHHGNALSSPFTRFKVLKNKPVPFPYWFCSAKYQSVLSPLRYFRYFLGTPEVRSGKYVR